MLRTLFIFLIFTVGIFAQSYEAYETVADTFTVNYDSSYSIKSPVIIPGGEQLFWKSQLLDRNDYSINYERGIFSFKNPAKFGMGDTIIFRYRTIKLKLRKEYFRHELVKLNISGIKRESPKVRVSKDSFSREEIFGSNMKKSGTLVRGFTIGTNRDMKLNSGLRLQLAGKLTDDISIVAALTDENTPIQPEGNSERLEELDKVFIQIKHPFAEAVFGDYDLSLTTGEFSNIKRKLQGLKIKGFYGNQNAEIAYASARGKFNTNQFNGIDGVQGPYRLTGANNERDIIIIAGSERVFVDGIEMKRGENKDYVIEYANAELTFTPTRLITSASRITVDFEYTDRRYQRNFFSTSGLFNVFNNKLKLGFNYFDESDDKDSPIDLVLNDNDKAILENAGDDIYSASISGVSLAQPDSNGVVKGIYTKIDTSIDGKAYSYYVYNPGAPTSLYNVVFSYVGQGNGDYKKVSIGNYQFTGINKGSYAPVVFLPLPESKQLGNLTLSGDVFKNLNISLEFAGSAWDKNRFSSIDDNDNDGYATKIMFTIKPVNLLSFNDGNQLMFGASFKNRYVNKRFKSIDRINEIEFNRNYNITNTEPQDEILNEGNVDISYSKNLTLTGKYGSLKRGDFFNSDRIFSKLQIQNVNWLAADFTLDNVRSENLLRKSSWQRQNGKVAFIIGNISPGVEYLYENKDEHLGTDSLLTTSLKYLEVLPFFNLSKWKGVSIMAKLGYREEHYPLNGILLKESEAVSKIFTLGYNPGNYFRTNLNLILRDKKYTASFARQGRTNNQTLLIRSTSKMNLLKRFIEGDFYYQTATEKSARLEKVFVRVPVGTGNYIYLGDLNNNGIAEEGEFEQSIYDADYILTTVPTDELFPVVTLRTNLRWRFNFDKIVKGNNLFGRMVKALGTETVWKVEEKSKESEISKIYLMNSSALLNDSTTLNGSQFFQQDIFILRTNREISFRLRFQENRNLNQYASGLSRSYRNLKSLRIKFRMVKEINNQTDINFIADNNISPVSSKRSRNVNTSEFISDFSYRPVKNLEVGFRISVSRSEDRFPLKPTVLDKNVQLVRVSLSFLRKGRLRIQFERNEIISNTSDNFIPYEILNGNAVGKNYLARLNFDYRIAGNLQTTINYLGRKQGGGRIIHQLTAEARAYF